MCAQFHQLRQATLDRAASISPQFSRSSGGIHGRPERLVDALLGVAGDLGVVVDAEQAVLAELEPHPHGARADGDVVVLAAGEVLHGRAEALAAAGRARPPAGPRGPPCALALFSPRASTSSTCGQATKRSSDGDGGGTGDQQVEIADGFAPAPQAAGGRDRLDARDLAQASRSARRRRLRRSSAGSARALPVLRDRAQHLLFELGAHARQARAVSAPGRGAPARRWCRCGSARRSARCSWGRGPGS